MFDDSLLQILCCPETKADLVKEGDTLVSTDAKTRYVFKIVDDIPIMLLDEAVVMDEKEWQELMAKHGKASK